METIYRFMASDAIGRIGVNILRTFLAWVLLILSIAFPVAGWHRLFLKIPGWYWWPTGFIVASYAVFTSYLLHQNVWLLMAFPIPLLLVVDSLRILSIIWRKQP